LWANSDKEKASAGITIQITKLIAQRMRALTDDPLLEKGSENATVATPQNVSSTLNLRTVAILPVTAGVPVVEFGHRLLTAFTQIGIVNGVTSLNQAAILNVPGRHAFSRMGKLKLSQYLTDLKEKFGMVLYIADTSVNASWAQTCIAQADCILLVGLAEGSPNVGEYERFLLGMKTTAGKSWSYYKGGFAGLSTTSDSPEARSDYLASRSPEKTLTESVVLLTKGIQLPVLDLYILRIYQDLLYHAELPRSVVVPSSGSVWSWRESRLPMLGYQQPSRNWARVSTCHFHLDRFLPHNIAPW
jgi:hypothetical protein